MKRYDTGDNSWNHGEAVDWHSNRAVARSLLGPCPDCGSITSTYGSAYSCHGRYCQNSAGQFACGPAAKPDWWNTDMNVKLDGDQWCAYRDGFVNLQESDSGWGKTPRDAVTDLISSENIELTQSDKRL